MIKQIVIVHGWEGYPEEGWRPWLRKKLEEGGYKVKIPAMPDTKNPVMENWVKYLSEVIKNPDKNTYLVGHSLGCITILRYLEQLKDNIKIGGVIFVAGFSYDLEYEGYRNELEGFFKTPVNWEKINKHCKKFFILHSEDDAWVPVKHAYLFKEKLNAETIIQNGMKHYSGDDGVFELSIVFDKLIQMSV